MLRFLLLIPLLCNPLLAAGIDLRLPTDNEHLFHNNPEQFYMYVDRTFEGETTKPWQGGAYGYVRNPFRIDGHFVTTRFHEGIDIKPLKRDRDNRPLDEIRSIAKGRVAYINPIAGHSNYGRYLIVEHRWEKSSIYSLYAHLETITCKLGDNVEAGDPLAIMGYTGSGLNRTRAHLHLEICMMMSTRFQKWAGNMINHHGNFNGMNLCGSDVARFFLSHRDNPEITFSEFISNTPVYFKVLTPAKRTPDFVKRHPWICHGDPKGARSWEVSFSATGMPVAFTPSTRVINQPIITAIRPSDIPHRYNTRQLIQGENDRVTLSSKGHKLLELVMDNF